jgi:spermidine/putrescine ABC transporter ATP-binding subunit
MTSGEAVDGTRAAADRAGGASAVGAAPPGAAPSVEVIGVSKRFGERGGEAGEVVAVDDVSLAVGRGEFFALLGPSGCGKTTLLRLIAGFESPTAGTLRVAGEDVTRLPAHRRPVHLVFQHYALFPHLTVAENVAFGLRYRHLTRAERAARTAEAVALVQLGGLEARRPRELSGGQRQRVALARALVLEPQVLLLDEPLAALDRRLRQEMQGELKALQRNLGITFLFVTHDQEEALAMSDRVAVMSRGKVEQLGAPAAVYERPSTPFVAEFLGMENLLTATVVARTGGELALRLPSGAEIPAPPDDPHANRPLAIGDAIRCAIRPEKLRLAAAADGPGFPVTIEDRVYQGATTTWIVRDTAGARFVVADLNREPNRAHAGGNGWKAGDAAHLCWDPRYTVLLREG